MDVFADAVEDDGTVDIFLQLADYYAKNMNPQKTGFFYYKAGHYSKVFHSFFSFAIIRKKKNCNLFFPILLADRNGEFISSILKFVNMRIPLSLLLPFTIFTILLRRKLK